MSPYVFRTLMIYPLCKLRRGLSTATQTYLDLGLKPTSPAKSLPELRLRREVQGWLIAARSGHGHFAAYHERFGHVNKEKLFFRVTYCGTKALVLLNSVGVYYDTFLCWNAGLWRRHDRSACLHWRSVHEAIPHSYLWGKADSHFSYSCHYHHLEIISQSIKPTVERLSYILHDSSISRDPHLLTS